MNLKNIIAIITLVAFSFSAYALTEREQRIADRLAPIGSVCMAGEACAAGASTGVSGPKDPETVYNTYCMACHLTGATEAPIMGNIEAWAPRIAKGADTLYSNAINGVNLMPAKGLCTDCSDEDIKATVDYIMSKSQ